MSHEDNSNTPAPASMGNIAIRYQNEDEDEVRLFVMNLEPLEEQCRQDQLSDDYMNGTLQGIGGTLRVLFENYNIYPKDQPIRLVPPTEAEASSLVSQVQSAITQEAAGAPNETS